MPGPGIVTAQGYVPLFPSGAQLIEQLQYTEADGTLVTLAGFRTTDRHARERGEGWFEADRGPGAYFTFPTFYFQNRTLGLEIRDTIPAGGKKIQIFLHSNAGTFDGTTFSLFRNILNPDVRDYGWSMNTGFNNPKEGNRPICHAGQAREDCMIEFNSNWRTDPHSPLQIGDKIELAPAVRLARDAQGRALIDGGGSRYYSLEQLYVVGKGLRPWYGIAPNLDSEPLPDATLLGGDTSISYNYAEEPMRVFQQPANNIGIRNVQRFVEGRRLFHTSFKDGRHSEHDRTNPVFTAHIANQGPRFNQESCIACHVNNGRSAAPDVGTPLDMMVVMTGTAMVNGRRTPHADYGLNVQHHVTGGSSNAWDVTISRFDTQTRTLPDGTQVALRKPVYAFRGPVPNLYSVRQAPQVIGAGLLEAVPETSILAMADPDDRNGDGIRGVFNLVTDPETGQPRVGRFGWKASKASVRHQAAEAMMNDMSVTSTTYPRHSCQLGASDCRSSPGSTALSELELQRLTHYLSLLGVPAQRSLRSGYPSGMRVAAEHDVDTATINRGASLFASVGCSACHVSELRTSATHPFAELRNQTIRPYTDLLLHDMGPDLADTVQEYKAAPSMWRTAPLWGMGSLKYTQGAGKARFLHDGRARTPLEAILWHGGEADAARQRFEALPAADRDAVLQFLESL
ncbi:di-heme oxidoreductase family protein [Uliginosibacterium sp. H1]|uniref:di-heme oxidoreductase family protein n=1 Tax=Uliginosibacterium sp. H1 TaxID=3114757 RepID=UPI002E17D6A2|nr:di-heme oxidoredictase family protein [Uliginosibacterium sp. H1]